MGARRARHWSAPAGLAVAASLVLAAGGCGVPTGGGLRELNTERIPYNLLDHARTASGLSGGYTRNGTQGSVAMVDRLDRVVLLPRALPELDRLRQVQYVLDQLAQGPRQEERATGYGSLLPPGTTLMAARRGPGIVTVEVSAPPDGLPADQLPVEVAQVVLTATSVPGIRAVLITQAAQPVEAPLPGGELTSRPLTANDYEPLLADSS